MSDLQQQQQICSICLSSIENRDHDQVVTTICGHTFCNECLQTWLNFRSTCPTCRRRIQEFDDFEDDEEEEDTSDDDDDDDLPVNEYIFLIPSPPPPPPLAPRWSLVNMFGDGDVHAWYYIPNPAQPELPNNQGILTWLDASPDHPILGTEGRKQYTKQQLDHFLDEMREKKRNQIKDIRNGTNLLSQGPQISLDGILFSNVDIEDIQEKETMNVPFIE